MPHQGKTDYPAKELPNRCRHGMLRTKKAKPGPLLDPASLR